MGDHIELEVPARAEFLSLARLVVGAASSAMDATLDTVEDIQLAVDEICLALLAPQPPGDAVVRVVIDVDDVALRVSARLRTPPRAAPLDAATDPPPAQHPAAPR